ncbi:MAG: HK97 family phage prohead protease, partial [Clostridia bacterium]|nr:HK97 family phage prohead protease [Clostridia bacterium]
IMQFDHTGMVYARTRNGSLTVSTDDHGLWVEADLGLTEDSRKLYDAISKGLIDRMSFCFTVREDVWDKETRTSIIMQIDKLYDVSAVSIPANPGTDIAAERKKRMDGAIQEERAERLAQEALKRRIQRLKVRAKAIRAAE